MVEPDLSQPSAPADSAPVAEDTSSLADHEQQFSPTATAGDESTSDGESPEERDDHGRFRHRAKSQEAKPDDVATIKAYTKRLRDAEAAAGIEQKPGESQRVYELRRRAELAEAKAAETAKPAQQAAPAVQAPTADGFKDASGHRIPFHDPQGRAVAFPKFELWSAHNPTLDYEDYTDARQDFRTQQKGVFEAYQRQQQQAQWSLQDISNQHAQRSQTYRAANPTFDADIAHTLDSRAWPLTPVLQAAILQDPNGPAIVHALAKQPDFYGQMFFSSQHTPLTPQAVAVMQRTLNARVQAAPTGSAAPRLVTPAPRPPNPVRTGPLKTGDEPPGDDSSLAAHEKAYGTRGRRS